jgi:hypothetical protein
VKAGTAPGRCRVPTQARTLSSNHSRRDRRCSGCTLGTSSGVVGRSRSSGPTWGRQRVVGVRRDKQLVSAPVGEWTRAEDVNPAGFMVPNRSTGAVADETTRALAAVLRSERHQTARTMSAAQQAHRLQASATPRPHTGQSALRPSTRDHGRMTVIALVFSWALARSKSR